MIGLKMAIATIIRRFRVLGMENPEDIPFEYMATLRPKNGVFVTLHPR